jgi:uncharacterized protein (DUF2141 family)
MNHIQTIAIVLVLAIANAAAVWAADLTIAVNDVHSAAGSVFIAVYDSEAGFMKPALVKVSRKLKATKGQVKFVIADLPAGKYAVASYHDENDNGKMDKNAYGVPTEGFGFSNDAQGSGGPPKFAQAAVDFDGKTDKSIAFSLNY